MHGRYSGALLVSSLIILLVLPGAAVSQEHGAVSSPKAEIIKLVGEPEKPAEAPASESAAPQEASESSSAESSAAAETAPKNISSNDIAEIIDKSSSTMSADAPGAASTQGERLTRLRVLGRPEGVWERRKTLTLQSVSAEVRNVGEVEAKDVVVNALLPGGDSVRLDGPVVLNRNETATYKAQPAKTITTAGEDIRVNLSCSNCRSR